MSNTAISAAGSSLKPRLATSHQWTALPAEFLTKVRAVFEGQFPIESENGEFIIDGRIYTGEIIIRIGYLESGRLKQINFEASMDLPTQAETPLNGSPDIDKAETLAAAKSKTMEQLYVCIDSLGSVFEEYFENGDTDDEEAGMEIPIFWRAFDFEGDTVYLQHSTANTRLEEEADRLLGLAEKKLVHEDSETEDALAKAEIDSDLAFEVQKAIRSGKYPRMAEAGMGDDYEEEFEN